MATALGDAQDRSVSIGRIFSRAFGTIGHNPVATLGIAFLFGAVPSVALNYVVQNMQGDLLTLLGTWGTVALSLITFVIGIALAMITQGALVRATIAESEGRTAGFGESAMAGLAVALPLFLLSLLTAFAVGFGFILLIVPGVILFIMWSVAAPALVDERLGVLASLSRSSALTSGARWKIFGLCLVVLVVLWIITAVWGVVAVMIYGGPIAMVNSMQQGLPIGMLVTSGIVSTITSVFSGTIWTSLFVELRDWKDGPRGEQLAEVFA